ncbi:MAG: acyl-CoA reductase [bacterium]|nr:acyl-CoA reductase [bacterium]
MTSTILDLAWLPDVELGDGGVWELPGEGVVARVPRLTPAGVHEVAERVRAARASFLGSLPADRIAELVGSAVNRWLDPFSPYLAEACRLLPAFTGYPEPAVRKGLGSFLSGYRTENLRRLLEDELGDPEVLDGFRPRRGAAGRWRAHGPDLVVHSFAGNTPGLPAQSLIASLLAKSASLGKVAAGEPVFASLFARSLAEVEPALGACVAVTYWPSSAEDVAAAAFGEGDAVVAYGADEAIAGVRRLAPPRARFIEYGHRVSLGVLCRERLGRADTTDLAERAAYDVARFDQQGCLSPHLLYVEEGGEADAGAFAEALAGALERWSRTVPRGRLTAEERARVAEVLREHEFRSAAGGGAVHRGDEWAVLVDRSPAFAPSCLNRVVWVKPVPDAAALGDLLAPIRGHLQTVGLAAGPDREAAVAEVLGACGADRVCPLGQMGDPLPTWHHDGRPPLLDLLRFTDLDPELPGGRWELAHPEAGVLGRTPPRVAGS